MTLKKIYVMSTDEHHPKFCFPDVHVTPVPAWRVEIMTAAGA